ncbi:MAG: MltA domain-containing protein [Alphaproteobacteria bacterium]
MAQRTVPTSLRAAGNEIQCRLLFVFAAVLALAACEPEAPPPEAPPAISLTPAAIEDLPGWASDDLAAALPAWRLSCEKMRERPADAPIGPDAIAGTAADWQPLCAALLTLPAEDAALRRFVTGNFDAYRVSAATEGDGAATGTFTGYYEAELRGARQPGTPYTVPLYKVPPDHVTVALGDFDPELKGKAIVGRVADGKLVPYHRRAAIDAGVLAGQGNELIWVDDPLDKFILQIQGSGVVVLPDGTTQRIGYAGNNGHRYASIGRWLIDKGELEPHEASWQGIRKWMEANPARVPGLLAVNERYIFFREIDGPGPIGAAGVPLTPERSLAVDLRYLPLDVPLWLDAENPVKDAPRLQRLMLAQDTGSAIRGVVRGDFFWGSGAPALAKAGRMKSKGGYWLLLPRALAKTG